MRKKVLKEIQYELFSDSHYFNPVGFVWGSKWSRILCSSTHKTQSQQLEFIIIVKGNWIYGSSVTVIVNGLTETAIAQPLSSAPLVTKVLPG